MKSFSIESPVWLWRGLPSEGKSLRVCDEHPYEASNSLFTLDSIPSEMRVITPLRDTDQGQEPSLQRALVLVSQGWGDTQTYYNWRSIPVTHCYTFIEDQY